MGNNTNLGYVLLDSYYDCTIIGIDSAAMFQECFMVLRSIVLHSLGITSQFSPDSGQHAAIQNLAIQISPQTQAKPSVAESVENDLSPNKTHQMKASPRNKMGHAFMTPSPNSRISSGFGSLQDEEGSINYESSYDHESCQCKDHSDSHYPQRDPNLIKIEQRSQEHERKRRKRHKHHRHRSHDTASTEREPNHTTVSPRNEQNTAARVQRQDTDSNPPPPKGAWGAQLTSSTDHLTTSPDQLRVKSVESSSDNQSFLSLRQNPANRIQISSQTDESRNIAISRGMESSGTEESVRSPPQAKVLSPRAEKQRQKLHSKHVELLKSKEEKERLANEVNLLNLKVLEEGTK